MGNPSLLPYTARVCAVHSVPAALQPFADLGEDRLFVGELAGLELGIHQLVIDRQLKTPAAGRLQLQALKALFVLAEDLGRQTDGLRLVVSSRAIAQMDFHVRRSPVYHGCSRIPNYLPLPRVGLFFEAFFFEGGADFFASVPGLAGGFCPKASRQLFAYFFVAPIRMMVTCFLFFILPSFDRLVVIVVPPAVNARPQDFLTVAYELGDDLRLGAQYVFPHQGCSPPRISLGQGSKYLFVLFQRF